MVTSWACRSRPGPARGRRREPGLGPGRPSRRAPARPGSDVCRAARADGAPATQMGPRDRPDVPVHAVLSAHEALVHEEDSAALMGTDPDAVSPLTSEFLDVAQSGGTCVVRVTSSGFGTGADSASRRGGRACGPAEVLVRHPAPLPVRTSRARRRRTWRRRLLFPELASTRYWSTVRARSAWATRAPRCDVRGQHGTLELVGERHCSGLASGSGAAGSWASPWSLRRGVDVRASVRGVPLRPGPSGGA